MANTVCEVCGDIGIKQLLLCCADCKGAATHQYCLKEVLYDASLADWFCDECQQKRGEVAYSRSLVKLSSERLAGHGHFSSTLHQPITKRVELARLLGSRGSQKGKSNMARIARVKKKYSSRMKSFQKRCIKKKPNMGSTGRPDLFSSLEDVEQLTPSIVNCSGYSLGGTDQSHLVTSMDVLAQRENAVSVSKNLESSNPTTEQRHMVPEICEKKLKCLKDRKPSSVLENSEETEASKLNECPVTCEVNSKAGNKSSDEILMSHKVEERGGEVTVDPSQNTSNSIVEFTHEQCNSSKAKETPNPRSALEGNQTGQSIIQSNIGNDNPKKRRRLILPDDDDDDDGEMKAENMQLENANPRSNMCPGPMTKNDVDAEYYVEAVPTGCLNDQNDTSGRPVKRQRKYIDANGGEDEEDIVGAASAKCDGNDALNCSLHDDPKLALQNVVAMDNSLTSRAVPDSEPFYQQNYIYSQPIDEPVWSGVFKVDSEVFVKLDAHMSTKACQRVWELSRSLQPVLEVTKLPRLQTWPKRWVSSGPTDDSIGLFFFPHNLRPNEVSNRLVNKIIKSDDALKVTVGIAELLIFPSSLLPEQYHLFQGKHYLWGVFRRREDMADKEQDVPGVAAEEGELQEQYLLDQKDEVRHESTGQENFVVKHFHEDQLLVERDCEPQETNKIAPKVGIASPGCSCSYAKADSPNAESNCSVQPRIEHKLHVPEDMDQQEGSTSSLEWNASSVTRQSSDSGHAAVTTKLINPAGHEQPRSDSEPAMMKLVGFVAARTPRSQQLIQEMASEGAVFFSVPEEVVTTNSSAGNATGVGLGLNADTEYPHPRERPQSFDFVSSGHDEPDVASESCLELFPVRQEQIGWAPRAEVSKEVDLDLSLGAHQRPPSLPPL
ncbi:hypothetical protein ACP4OV_003192 [Aristida adscensionis]